MKDIAISNRVLWILDGALRGLTLTMLALSGIAICFIALLATADIIAVNLLGSSIASAIEMQEASAAVAIVGAMAAVQAGRANIEVDLITGLLPPRARRMTEALAGLCGVVVFGVLAWQGGKLALHSWDFGELNHGFVDFPIYPFKILVALGFAIATLQFVRLLLASAFGGHVYPPQNVYPTTATDNPGAS